MNRSQGRPPFQGKPQNRVAEAAHNTQAAIEAMMSLSAAKVDLASKPIAWSSRCFLVSSIVSPEGVALLLLPPLPSANVRGARAPEHEARR